MYTGFTYPAENKESVKKTILGILSVKWPLAVNELHKAVREKHFSTVSYQAVHKTLKQLQEEGCVEKITKKYQISPAWIKAVAENISLISKNYNVDAGRKAPYFNVILAKDDFISSKIKKENVASVLRKLVTIFKNAFRRHNIFELDDEEILDYLLEMQRNNEILMLQIAGEIAGGAVLEKMEDIPRDRFQRWDIRHFACKKDVPRSEKKKFIAQIEQRVKRKQYRTKLHITMAETEKEYLGLFLLAGFRREALFYEHFRPNERAFMYSKIIS